MQETSNRRCDPRSNDCAALIERCRQGDRSAWDQIVERYQRLVFAVALREGMNREGAADITQETFALLVRHLDSIQQPDRLSSWLTTTARRLVWREGSRLSPPSVPLREVEPTVDDLTDETVQALWVYEAVQQLDEPCRSLILSLYFDPAAPSYSQVAVSLGRPLGSVGPLRARCLDRLRAILVDGEED